MGVFLSRATHVREKVWRRVQRACTGSSAAWCRVVEKTIELQNAGLQNEGARGFRGQSDPKASFQMHCLDTSSFRSPMILLVL